MPQTSEEASKGANGRFAQLSQLADLVVRIAGRRKPQDD